MFLGLMFWLSWLITSPISSFSKVKIITKIFPAKIGMGGGKKLSGGRRSLLLGLKPKVF